MFILWLAWEENMLNAHAPTISSMDSNQPDVSYLHVRQYGSVDNKIHRHHHHHHQKWLQDYDRITCLSNKNLRKIKDLSLISSFLIKVMTSTPTKLNLCLDLIQAFPTWFRGIPIFLDQKCSCNDQSTWLFFYLLAGNMNLSWLHHLVEIRFQMDHRFGGLGMGIYSRHDFL